MLIYQQCLMFIGDIFLCLAQYFEASLQLLNFFRTALLW